MNEAIVLKDVTKRYDTFLLDHISFTVPRGSIVGLIGENGAGKTTTLRLILNRIRPDEGQIEVLGHKRADKTVREQIGVVLSEGGFYENFTAPAVDKVMRGIYRNWDSARFEQYRRRFDLPEKKTLKQYSRGMKMKLYLAAALSHRAELLILDEATSGLDPMTRSDVSDMFLEFISDEKNSILFSSHITSDLEKIADYIVFIHKGKLIFNESKDVLLESYGILKCSLDCFDRIDAADICGWRKNRFGCEVLIKDRAACRKKYGSCVIDSASLEEIMTFIARGPEA